MWAESATLKDLQHRPNSAYAKPDPARAYRRVQRDAAILGSDPQALTLLCYDEFLAAISAALNADPGRSAAISRKALAQASSALCAIRAGVDEAHPMAPVIGKLLSAAEIAVGGAMVRLNPISLQALHDDFSDIRNALFAAKR